MSANVECDTLDLPVIDLEPFLRRNEGEEYKEAMLAEAKKAADALHRFGVLCVRDPRATEAENDVFLDMLEQYFEQPEDSKMQDVRKELHYQVGATPSYTELPRDHCDRMKAFKETDKPLSLCPPEKDPKWRFFWRIGERPAETKFPALNAEPVVPETFPQWRDVMNSWGQKLLNAAFAVAELAAIGFDLPEDAFSSCMKFGPHLLAPTASDFNRFGELGTVLAGFHYDLNFLTAHGRSRFPGLYVWTRDGSKRAVKIPAGCLLLQAGKQFEYMTGGHVLAGFHEVVVTPATRNVIEAKKAKAESLWRISSTLFSHIASDVMLQPLEKFAQADPSCVEKYPPMYTGEQVKKELEAINLAGDEEAIAAQ